MKWIKYGAVRFVKGIHYVIVEVQSKPKKRSVTRNDARWKMVFWAEVKSAVILTISPDYSTYWSSKRGPCPP